MDRGFQMYQKEYEDLINKSNMLFASCEWIESEGKNILNQLNLIDFLKWSKNKELLRNKLIKKLFFLIKKGQFEIKNLDILQNKLNKLKKKYAKS